MYPTVEMKQRIKTSEHNNHLRLDIPRCFEKKILYSFQNVLEAGIFTIFFLISLNEKLSLFYM